MFGLIIHILEMQEQQICPKIILINLGQLVRERKNNNNTVLVGFGTYKGSVIAAKRWGDKMEQMKVPSAISESWDNILHNIKNDSTIANSYTNNNNKLIIFSHTDDDINNKIKMKMIIAVIK